MKADEIIYQYCQGQMFPDPNYYDGRGNSVRDLNSPILELIYGGIKAEQGAGPAKAFVNMVKNLKNTNAKSFLLELYRLERKNWKYSVPIIRMAVADPGQNAASKPGSPVLPPPEPVRRRAEIVNAFTKSGSVFGHDKAITGDFLTAHKSEFDASDFASSFGSQK